MDPHDDPSRPNPVRPPQRGYILDAENAGELAFEDGSFDLLNGRLLGGFMLPAAWPWPRLLRQAGFLEGHLRPTVIEWSMGTQRHSPVFKDVLSGLERVLPFLERLGLAARAELTALDRQAVAEMQQEGFCARWPLLTVWGRTPQQAEQGGHHR
ncbi:hypothetical protein [Thermogemmatispora sp.]|uniref:hypothetical protein n=1 Tax=Thermogemmatispora sp. TaxID=1968838 RepID=UPI0035E420E9